MREEKFTGILGEINEEYINEVLSEEKPRKILPFRKWAALAACICILAVSGVAVIAEMSDMSYNIEQDVVMRLGPRDRNVSNIEVTVNLEEISKREINREVVKDFKNGVRTLYFDTAAEAEEYIGYDKLVFPDFGLEESTHYSAENPETAFSSSIWLMGKEKKLEQIYTMTYYETESDHSVFCTSRTLIGKSGTKQSITIPYLFADVFRDIESEERITENGTEYLVVSVPNKWGGGAYLMAFLVKDGTEYHFSGAYSLGSQKAEFEEYLLRWANSF